MFVHVDRHVELKEACPDVLVYNRLNLDNNGLRLKTKFDVNSIGIWREVVIVIFRPTDFAFYDFKTKAKTTQSLAPSGW